MSINKLLVEVPNTVEDFNGKDISTQNSRKLFFDEKNKKIWVNGVGYGFSGSVKEIDDIKIVSEIGKTINPETITRQIWRIKTTNEVYISYTGSDIMTIYHDLLGGKWFLVLDGGDIEIGSGEFDNEVFDPINGTYSFTDNIYYVMGDVSLSFNPNKPDEVIGDYYYLESNIPNEVAIKKINDTIITDIKFNNDSIVSDNIAKTYVDELPSDSNPLVTKNNVVGKVMTTEHQYGRILITTVDDTKIYDSGIQIKKDSFNTPNKSVKWSQQNNPSNFIYTRVDPMKGDMIFSDRSLSQTIGFMIYSVNESQMVFHTNGGYVYNDFVCVETFYSNVYLPTEEAINNHINKILLENNINANDWTATSDINDYIETGVYKFTGKRYRLEDNLPISNYGNENDTLSFTLIVNFSQGKYIESENKHIRSGISQTIFLENNGGNETKIYTRHGRINAKENDEDYGKVYSWTEWGEVLTSKTLLISDTSQLDEVVDNGIYVGIIQDSGTTVFNYGDVFKMEVINNYSVVGGDNKTVLQKIELVSVNSETYNLERIYKEGVWGQWENRINSYGITNDDNVSYGILTIYKFSDRKTIHGYAKVPFNRIVLNPNVILESGDNIYTDTTFTEISCTYNGVHQYLSAYNGYISSCEGVSGHDSVAIFWQHDVNWVLKDNITTERYVFDTIMDMSMKPFISTQENHIVLSTNSHDRLDCSQYIIRDNISDGSTSYDIPTSVSVKNYVDGKLSGVEVILNNILGI